MIVWVASYPRTGSKLIRGFLHQVFDLPSFSEYPPDHLNRRSRGAARAHDPKTQPLPFIGAAQYNGSFQDFYLHARRSEQGFLVKTHHPPLDDSPAIVMTRDGRSAVVSYYHFLQEIEQQQASLSDVIRGDAGIGTWSQFLDEWNPLERPQTLFLRFEDVISDPDLVTEMISSFLQLPPTGTWENRFAEMQKTNPLHYRSGKNGKNVSELSLPEEDLFWEFHQPWMETMGYTAPVAEFRSSMTSRIESPPKKWFHHSETVQNEFYVPGLSPGHQEKLPYPQRMYRYWYDKLFGHDPEAEEFRRAMRERRAKKIHRRIFGLKRRRAA